MKGSPDASLSFLDVLACALGGSALLFLILATLPHSGANATKASNVTTSSMVEATPAPAGAPAPASPRLFALEHHGKCRLSLDEPKDKPVVLGYGNALTERMRPEHWLRFGPDEKGKPVDRVVLEFEKCPPGEHFVIRAVRYDIHLEPIVLEVTAGKKTLVYNSRSPNIWGLE